jgi:low affinity Fe/Cu permease
MKRPNQTSLFCRFAKIISRATGRPGAFLTAIGLVLVWAITGAYFRYSTDWQLVINTGTTIITFLMVFLIQNTQNRDSEAMHLKLDELIRAMEGAHNALLDLEELEEKDLDKIRGDYQRLAKSAREAVRRGQVDTGRVELKRAPPGHVARQKE